MARPASDIAERIVRAARERFLSEGVDGASLRAIARDAGTNLGMVYYYFASKDELFLATIEDVYAALLGDLTAVLSESALPTEQQVERLYSRLAQVSEDELKVIRLILREAIGASSPRLAKLFERFTRGHLALVLGVIQTGMARQEVRTDLPPMLMVLATILLGIAPQLLRRRLAESGVPVDALLPPVASMNQALGHLLFEGIADAASPTSTVSKPAKPASSREKARRGGR